MKHVALICIALAAGCFPADKQAEAASAYEADQLRCVAQYANKPDIDSCRAKVKLAWMTDAGAEGGSK